MIMSMMTIMRMTNDDDDNCGKDDNDYDDNYDNGDANNDANDVMMMIIQSGMKHQHFVVTVMFPTQT